MHSIQHWLKHVLLLLLQVLQVLVVLAVVVVALLLPLDCWEPLEPMLLVCHAMLWHAVQPVHWQQVTGRRAQVLLLLQAKTQLCKAELLVQRDRGGLHHSRRVVASHCCCCCCCQVEPCTGSTEPRVVHHAVVCCAVAGCKDLGRARKALRGDSHALWGWQERS